ncbi:hypothetical protein Ciccas_005463 [Cichlidogyrus casuarinus]|uniref:GPI ethanolamine phosphate transferase 1 n=1 Tax=Cichlidogyrus casuarinus TaxID=1844966 RepID=A0ABD2Q8L0_9PLAT
MQLDYVLALLIFPFLFLTIFDVYYSSPLIHEVEQISYNLKATSDIVFLIISDGIQTRRLFSEPQPLFLKKILESDGVWGFSHTRVPTESRPGHVAILGGFYEDVSAVTKGWKANPVDFDSLFNHTCYSWAWGGPDVVPLFRLKALPVLLSDKSSLYLDSQFDSQQHLIGYESQVRIEAFPQELLDMESRNVTRVDAWVLDRFKLFLKEQGSTLFQTRKNLLKVCPNERKGRLVFLHLNAADQIGHSFKPTSNEYSEVIHYLDRFMDRFLTLINEQLAHFPSEQRPRVSFILTSDHGMTDWGSHGAGSLDETTTPFLAWGAGIRKAERINFAEDEQFLLKMGLDPNSFNYKRHDIEQADLAPLMASLLASPFPINSVVSFIYKVD